MTTAPVQGRVGSPFGWRTLNRTADYHSGVDIGAPEGAAVHAMLAGVVVAAEPSGKLEGYGNVAVLQHGPALFSLYAHLQHAPALELGQVVQEGQAIGAVGRTAGTRSDPAKMFAHSGAHLHLEFLSKWPPAGRDLDRIDPTPFLTTAGVAPVASSSSSSGAALLFLAVLAARAVQKRRPSKSQPGRP